MSYISKILLILGITYRKLLVLTVKYKNGNNLENAKLLENLNFIFTYRATNFGTMPDIHSTSRFASRADTVKFPSSGRFMVTTRRFNANKPGKYYTVNLQLIGHNLSFTNQSPLS